MLIKYVGIKKQRHPNGGWRCFFIGVAVIIIVLLFSRCKNLPLYLRSRLCLDQHLRHMLSFQKLYTASFFWSYPFCQQPILLMVCKGFTDQLMVEQIFLPCLPHQILLDKIVLPQLVMVDKAGMIYRLLALPLMQVKLPWLLLAHGNLQPMDLLGTDLDALTIWVVLIHSFMQTITNLNMMLQEIYTV